MNSPHALSLRIYQMLLACYPAEFRHEYGAEIAEAFEEKYRTQRAANNRLGLVNLWLETIVDVVVTAILQHVDVLRKDVLYSIRSLAKAPLFTTVAIATLAIGIGANCAIFSVINAVLLRNLPYSDPGRLAMLWTDDPRHSVHEEGTAFLNYRDWKSMSSQFEDMAVVTRGNPVTLTGGIIPDRVPAELVSANLFSLLGTAPLLGRTFGQDDEDNRRHVTVLSYGLWQSRFGGEPNAIGKKIDIDGQPSEIVGVMPKDFYFPEKATRLWQPVSIAPWWNRERGRRDSDWWRVVGRVKPSVSFAQAQAEMNSIGATLERLHHSNDPEFAGFAVNVVPMLVQVTGKNARLSLLILLGAVVLVLLIACTNVASLLLARGAGKERELALRRAIGASSSRLIRLMLTESMVIAVVSGLAGLGLAYAGVRFLLSLAPANIPRLDEASIDYPVLVFALIVTIFSGLLFGLTPALKLSRVDVAQSLKEGGRSLTSNRAGFRMRGNLIALQFALGMILLSSAGLLLRSFISIRSADPGFRPDHVLLTKITLPAMSDNSLRGSYDQILQRVRALPGVVAAGAVGEAFLERNPDQAISLEGKSSAGLAGGSEQLDRESASPEYFRAIGVPLVIGTIYKENDPGNPAVINESMARRYWPGENPIGKRFKMGSSDSKSQWISVVGVVHAARRQGYERDPIAEFFQPDWTNTMDLVVRTAIEPATIVAGVRRAVREVNPNVPVYDVSTAEARLDDMLAPRWFETTLISIFSLLALALATIGIYGLMHYLVVQRTDEIGIRMALGASALSVVRLVMGQGLRTAGVGVGLGLVGAIAAGRWISTMLYHVRPADGVTLGAVAAALLAAGALGCLIPAVKAARVDPSLALRQN